MKLNVQWRRAVPCDNGAQLLFTGATNQKLTDKATITARRGRAWHGMARQHHFYNYMLSSLLIVDLVLLTQNVDCTTSVTNDHTR